MKKLFTLVTLSLASICTINAQSVTQLNESFTSPFSSTTWSLQNNSVPLGPSSWAQGNGANFPAFSGGPNDYICNNFDSQGSVTGGISNFLITPTVSLMNGGVLRYAARTVTTPTGYADRMQVLMSYGTGNGSIPGGTTSVGTFTGLINDINPGLTSTGFPAVWTVYTHTLSGISGTITGRFAFRYFVDDGGPNGSNSDYIGLDNVTYTTAAACPPAPVVISPNTTTICAGGSVVLNASGATNYTWSTSSNSSSINVSPSSTTVYTLTGNNPPGCAGVTTATVFIGPPPVVSAPNVTACPSGTVSLNASGASTYSWSNGGTGSSIVITAPSGTTVTYTVTGFNGPSCSNTKTLTVSSSTFLSVSNESITACPNQVLIIGAAGASSYTWSTGQTTQSIAITPTANAIYYVTGMNGTCLETRMVNLTIDPNLFAPSFTTCAGTAATLIASGATSYSWSTGATTSVIVVSPSVATVYTITGTSGACSQQKTVSVTLGANLSVGAIQKCIGISLLLTGYGANSYTWQPINDFNSSVIVTPTAPTIYTLTGVSGTCTGTRTLQITWCASVNELELINESVRVYPNPFGTEVTIKDAYGDVRMINMLGNLVLSTTVDGSTKLNTEALSPGVYFILITNPKTIERKIIKVIKN